MKLVMGADHGGFELKAALKKRLEAEGHSVIDVGAAHYEKEDDYPIYSEKLAIQIADKAGERGILICGSGAGAGVAANKVKGARAVLVHDTFTAHQCVEDDNVNVLCLGARVVGEELAMEIVKAFLNAKFSNAERHLRRLHEVLALEDKFGK